MELDAFVIRGNADRELLSDEIPEGGWSGQPCIRRPCRGPGLAAGSSFRGGQHTQALVRPGGARLLRRDGREAVGRALLRAMNAGFWRLQNAAGE
jgi:hypothetical protein